MIRINLLPHRAEKRKRRQTQFIALCLVSAAIAGVIVGLVYGAFEARIAYQNARNAYLQREIVKLDKQIAQIKKLQDEIKALKARKEVVEKLQTSRSDVVHLLDQMLRILPPGVHLKRLTQKGADITILGAAQSDARVSTLMRSIVSSPYLDSPQLVEVHSIKASGSQKRSNEFTLTFVLKSGVDAAKKAEADKKAAAARAASAAAPAKPPVMPGSAKKG